MFINPIGTSLNKIVTFVYHLGLGPDQKFGSGTNRNVLLLPDHSTRFNKTVCDSYQILCLGIHCKSILNLSYPLYNQLNAHTAFLEHILIFAKQSFTS